MLEGVDLGFGGDLVAGFKQQLVEQTIAASVDTVINGGELDDALIGALQTAAVGAVGIQGAGIVGDWTDGTNGNVVANIIAHAALGCAVSSGGGNDCGSGAISGAVSASLGGLLEDAGLERERVPDALRVVSAAAVLLTGGDAGDVNAAASIAATAELYNRQLHTEEARLLRELAQEFADEQGISESEARRILVNQALYQVDRFANEQGSDNAVARAFLAANSPSGFIPGTEANGSPNYSDQNQTYFSADDAQFANSLINAGLVYEYRDLYNQLSYVDPDQGGLARHVVVNFASASSDLERSGDLSPEQGIALVETLLTARTAFVDDVLSQGAGSAVEQTLRDFGLDNATIAQLRSGVGVAAVADSLLRRERRGEITLTDNQRTYLTTAALDAAKTILSTTPAGTGADGPTTTRPGAGNASGGTNQFANIDFTGSSGSWSVSATGSNRFIQGTSEQYSVNEARRVDIGDESFEYVVATGADGQKYVFGRDPLAGTQTETLNTKWTDQQFYQQLERAKVASDNAVSPETRTRLQKVVEVLRATSRLLGNFGDGS